MKTLVFASQKGGGGKTTISDHMAVEAERRAQYGAVVMIDMDPQANLTGWFRERASETPILVRVLAEGLGATLRELRASDVALVVIDTPPAITEAICETCRLADLVVNPAKPSPHDLQATRPAQITADVAVSLFQHSTVAPVT